MNINQQIELEALNIYSDAARYGVDLGDRDLIAYVKYLRTARLDLLLADIVRVGNASTPFDPSFDENKVQELAISREIHRRVENA